MARKPEAQYLPPSPEEQLRFLERIQRLLHEGQFSATYKFALLHAIADLCVDRGEDGSGEPLILKTGDLASRFIDLYERQARPFPAVGGAHVLKQNRGPQARIVNLVGRAIKRYPGVSLCRVGDSGLVRRVDETVRKMPLWKLQTIGGEKLNFLYDGPEEYTVREITLKPGVAYCFRAFHRWIVSLIRDHWERWIRRENAKILQDTANLHQFLFDPDRENLVRYRKILVDVQGRRCFYTGVDLHGRGDVDHFIPWSHYPVDLGHNFVLASKSANSSKSDYLAAEKHLEKWLRHCTDHRQVLAEMFDEAGLPHALGSSIQIAEWSYSSVDRAGGQVWCDDKNYQRLSPDWRALIESARKELAVP